MSLPLDEVIAVLAKHLPSAQVQSIAKDLIAAEKAAKEEKVTEPRGKTRLVAMLRSADPAVKLAAQAGVFVLAVPDDDSTATYSGASLISRFQKAAIAHNEQPRKRRSKGKTKIETWQELFTHVKAKTFKASGSAISLKQKGFPCELVVLETEGIAP